MTCIGIALGSTSSSVARINTAGIPALVPDAQNGDSFCTPTIVHLGAAGQLVGAAAEVVVIARPDLPALREFNWLLASSASLMIDSAQKNWSAEEVMALLLNKLRGDAEALGEAVDSAVLTVPFGFGSHRRQALRRAAEAAGLQVRALVDEATAAAAYDSMNQPAERNVLVFNIGTRAFDATLLRCASGNIRRLAVRSDNSFGGRWIDAAIAAEMRSHLVSDQSQVAPAEFDQLLVFAEQLKISLSSAGSNQARQRSLIGKRAFEFVLTRRHLEQLIAPMLTRCMDACDACLKAANIQWPQVDAIVLVGGTCEMPAVRSAVASRSGLSAEKIASQQPRAAIAYGAAWLASRTDEQLAQLPDVISESSDNKPVPTGETLAAYDVGIRIGDPRTGEAAIYRLIKRNSPLPATAVKQFRTSRSDQSRLVIEVVQTKGSARRAASLGQFAIELPTGLPANHPVDVTMCYDANGQVHVKACAG